MTDALLSLKHPGRMVLPALPERDAPSVVLSDPALQVLTDFQKRPALAVDPGRRIGDAMQDMIHFGVRSLVVVNTNREVLGFVTAYDILGDRPIRYLQSPQCMQDVCRHEDVRVTDIMTTARELPMLEHNDLAHAKVQDLVKLFAEAGFSYLLVFTAGKSGTPADIVGLISATQLGRQLGMPIEVACTAKSLSDLHRTLGRAWQTCSPSA